MASRLSVARRSRLAGAALAAAMIAQPALAADTTPSAPAKPAQPKSAAKGKPKVMTRDELRACMNDQDRLQKITAEIKSGQAELERQKADVQRIDAEMASKVASPLDPNDTATLAALKDMGARRDAIADDYNTRLAGLREKSAAFDSGRKDWAERCADRDFDERDEAAIRLEQKKAAAAAKSK